MTKIERNNSILECHKIGISQQQIGKIFSLAQSTISTILKAMKNPIPPLEKKVKGPKSRLTIGQKDELKQILLKSPKDYGYFTWNKWSIKSIIKQEFKVDYHENYICVIMKCINYTSQKPQLKDYRKNSKLVQDFQMQKAPDIKKSSVR